MSCGSTLNICQDVLKSASLLQKQGFVDSQMHTSQLSLGDWTFGNNIEIFE